MTTAPYFSNDLTKALYNEKRYLWESKVEKCGLRKPITCSALHAIKSICGWKSNEENINKGGPNRSLDLHVQEARQDNNQILVFRVYIKMAWPSFVSIKR